jgi:sterol desaturase/sphingolipid hydroxylase (fatty acid hydroxylase superfamily)
MEAFRQWLAEFVALVHLGQLAKSTALAFLVYSAFLLAVYLLEARGGADPARYRTRHFANDVIYTLFYKGGFFNVLVLAAATNALEPHLGFLRLNLLGGLPWPVGLALFWVVGDFVTYWWHRLQHGNRFLWAFHSVHHSQEQMTLFTASRRHPLEALSMVILLYFGIFNLVLGIPTRGWMPLAAAITCILSLQHAQLDWRYGRFGRLLVSPRFHAFHHSTDPRHANANFGTVFSCWDYLFGTAVAEQPLPTRYGVDGLGMGESWRSQLLLPFQLLWRWRRRPVPTARPATPPAAP